MNNEILTGVIAGGVIDAAILANPFIEEIRIKMSREIDSTKDRVERLKNYTQTFLIAAGSTILAGGLLLSHSNSSEVAVSAVSTLLLINASQALVSFLYEKMLSRKLPASEESMESIGNTLID